MATKTDEQEARIAELEAQAARLVVAVGHLGVAGDARNNRPPELLEVIAGYDAVMEDRRMRAEAARLGEAA